MGDRDDVFSCVAKLKGAPLLLGQIVLEALETDILIEADVSPERLEFNRIRKEQGLKAALAWRDARA